MGVHNRRGSIAKLLMRSGRVELHADHPDQSAQRAPFPGRGDSAVRPLVPALSRLVKIFMRRGCSTGVSRRGVLDSGCQIADRFMRSRSGEEQNVILTLVVAFFLIQVSNTTPILGISVKSAIPGIRGTAGQYGYMPLS